MFRKDYLFFVLRQTLGRGLHVGSCFEKISFTVLRRTLRRELHVGSCLEKTTVIRHLPYSWKRTTCWFMFRKDYSFKTLTVLLEED